MSVLSANVRHAAAKATLSLPFRIPPQEWFTLREAAAVLGLAESTVEKLYEQHAFTGHSHNAGTPPRKDGRPAKKTDQTRKHKRIMRSTLVAYAVRTADYDDEGLCDLYCSALNHLPTEALQRIAAQCQQLLHARR